MKKITNSDGEKMSYRPIAVIHVDALRREYLSSWYLGERLKEKGFRVLLTSRHSTRRFLKSFSPDVFVCTHVFQLTPREWHSLCQQGTRVYINEVEGVDIELGVAATYPASLDEDSIDYNLFSSIFVWSIYTSDWIIRNRGARPSNVRPIGSIRQSKFLRTSGRSSHNTVGIISRFEVINTFDNRHFFENLMQIDPEALEWRSYIDRCAIDSETFSIVCKFIGEIVAKGFKVSMRPHPNENLDSYKVLKRYFGPKFFIDNSYSINEWLSKVSVVFGPTSTGYTEAYLLGLPIVSTSAIQRFHFTHQEYGEVMRKFDSAAYQPKTVEEAVSLCSNHELVPTVSSELDSYMSKFYQSNSCVDPIDAVVEDILAHQSSKSSSSSWLYYFWCSSFLLILDFLAIAKQIMSPQPGKKIRSHKIYNFNRFLHRPSVFMRNLIKDLH